MFLRTFLRGIHQIAEVLWYSLVWHRSTENLHRYGYEWHIQEAYQGDMQTINFTNKAGVDLIKEFYKTLQPKELAKVEKNLKELKRLGMFATPPLKKQLNDFIYEFRTKANDVYIRILFFKLPGNEIVFTLHLFLMLIPLGIRYKKSIIFL